MPCAKKYFHLRDKLMAWKVRAPALFKKCTQVIFTGTRRPKEIEYFRGARVAVDCFCERIRPPIVFERQLRKRQDAHDDTFADLFVVTFSEGMLECSCGDLGNVGISVHEKYLHEIGPASRALRRKTIFKRDTRNAQWRQMFNEQFKKCKFRFWSNGIVHHGFLLERVT